MPAQPVDEQGAQATAALLSEDWFNAVAQARFARSRGDEQMAQEWMKRHSDSFTDRMARVGGLDAAWALLVIFGVLTAVRSWWRGQPAGTAAPMAATWEVREGLGVVVWGLLLGNLLFVILSLVPAFWWASNLYAVVCGFPVLWLTWWKLSQPAGKHLDTVFGLLVSRGNILAGVSLLAVEALAGSLLGVAAMGLGVRPSPLESVQETLIWGPPFFRVLSVLNISLGTGFFEELAFRGVLFLTLRRCWGFWPAAVLSSVCFGAAHFYGLQGFLTVTVFGVLQAWSVERTRSLMPAIIAHAVTNLMYCLRDLYVFG